MSLAYFPLYPDDFEADTAHLTLAEDGAYNRLLRLCWRSPGCCIPTDRQWIYRRLRALTEDDKSVVDTVLSEFFTTTGDSCSNARLTKEWLVAKEAHERRVSSGQKGGKAKALKTNDSAPSNARAMLKQPEPEPEPVVVAAPRAAEDLSIRERLLSAMGLGPDGITGPTGFIGTQVDMAEAASWASMGLSQQEQCAVIAEGCARARKANARWMPRRFAYFTGAMADLAAKKSQPVPTGTSQPQTLDDKRAKWRKAVSQ